MPEIFLTPSPLPELPPTPLHIPSEDSVPDSDSETEHAEEELMVVEPNDTANFDQWDVHRDYPPGNSYMDEDLGVFQSVQPIEPEVTAPPREIDNGEDDEGDESDLFLPSRIPEGIMHQKLGEYVRQQPPPLLGPVGRLLKRFLAMVVGAFATALCMSNGFLFGNRGDNGGTVPRLVEEILLTFHEKVMTGKVDKRIAEIERDMEDGGRLVHFFVRETARVINAAIDYHLVLLPTFGFILGAVLV